MFERECADRYGNTLGAENNATVPGYGSARSARSEDKANCPLHMEENRSRLDSGEMMRLMLLALLCVLSFFYRFGLGLSGSIWGLSFSHLLPLAPNRPQVTHVGLRR